MKKILFATVFGVLALAGCSKPDNAPGPTTGATNVPSALPPEAQATIREHQQTSSAEASQRAANAQRH